MSKLFIYGPIFVGGLLFEAGRGRQVGTAAIASVLALLIALARK
jgi:hypothetical protein